MARNVGTASVCPRREKGLKFSRASPYLEFESQSQLNLTRRSRADGTCIYWLSDHSKFARPCGIVRGWSAKLVAIEDIECFGPKLEAIALAQWNSLTCPNVGLPQARSAANIPPSISKCTRGRNRKGGGVDPS